MHTHGNCEFCQFRDTYYSLKSIKRPLALAEVAKGIFIGFINKKGGHMENLDKIVKSVIDECKVNAITLCIRPKTQLEKALKAKENNDEEYFRDYAKDDIEKTSSMPQIEYALMNYDVFSAVSSDWFASADNERILSELPEINGEMKERLLIRMNPTEADKVLEKRGFYLKKIIYTPVGDVRPDAKQYIYGKYQMDSNIIFDTQQNSIYISDDWYSCDDMEAMKLKARELGI